MHTLNDIEQATGQTFPPLYRRLHQAGHLSWNGPHPRWYQACFPALQAAPPALLYAQDYEPLEHGELLEAWQDLTAEDHYNPLRQDLHLLPFARTGAGDNYCFWTNAPGFAEPPVLLVWHDDDRADLLAANFQDFLFRKMAEAVVELEETLLDEGSVSDNLQAWLGTHRAWLRPDQAAALEALYARSEAIDNGGIPEDEVEALLDKVIGFARKDESMAYVQE